jgi:hypothetical protein
MSERLRKAHRILAVQTQLDRLAEWTLMDLKAQAMVLADQRQGLIRFMDEEPPFAGIFAATMMRRLQAAAEAQVAITNETEAQKIRHREERARLRCAERIVGTLEGEARRRVEANQLAEAIEAALTRGS